MKQCPQCNRTYPDDTLAFCLADGALLSASYSPEETLLLPSARTTNPPSTEILPSQQKSPKEVRNNPKIIYAIIALMSIVIITLAGVIIIPRMSQESKNDNADTNQTTRSDDESAKAVVPDSGNVKAQGSSLPDRKSVV